MVFDAPSEAIDELERSLNITEEVMRHLVTRIERPASRRTERADDDEAAEDEAEEATDEDSDTPPPDDEDETEGEFIDESESEAAPKAV